MNINKLKFLFNIWVICGLMAIASAQAATLTVTKTADTNDGLCNEDCSLREAIAVAAPGNTIEFAAPLFDSPQVITLSNAVGFGNLVINKNLIVNGRGANLLTVSGGAGANYRIFNVNGGGVNVFLNNLTVTGGVANGFNGGGINANSGVSLVLTGVHITGNVAGLGGGLFVTADSNLILVNTTVSGNTALLNAAGGGGIHNLGVLNAANSTVSGNVKTTGINNGGGVWNSGTAEFTNSTITDNGADGANGVGGFYNQGTATIRSTIIAANRDNSSLRPDLFGAFTSDGYNFIGNIGFATGFNQTGDQTSSEEVLDPRLNTLANNGGATPTHSLLSTSPAIDKGNSFGFTTDQRGNQRPIDRPNLPPADGGDNSDIGAYESPMPLTNTAPVAATTPNPVEVNEDSSVDSAIRASDADADNLTFTITDQPDHGTLSTDAPNCFISQNTSLCANPYTYTPTPDFNGADSFSYKANDGQADSAILVININVTPVADAAIVTKTADTDDGVCDADCSLREAITAANAESGETISFSIPTSDAGYDAVNGRFTITLGALGALPDLGSLTMTGLGANVLTVQRNSAAAQFRIFKINSGANVEISGLTISGGDVATNGGGIFNQGILTLSRVNVSGNSALQFGGGIDNFPDATLTITDSTVSGNLVGIGGGGGGGGISASGTLIITNSTVSSNSAFSGGGIITFSSSTLTVRNSTISHNSAQDSGGGIFSQSTAPTLRNTIVADNTAARLNSNQRGVDLSGTFISQGFNLISNNSGAIITPTTGDQIGTVAAPIDPILGALQNNGGTTLTRALLAGSPAIDKGDDDSAVPTADQRGNLRPVDLADATYPNTADASDIGAFEAQTIPSGSSLPTFTVSKIADTNDGVCDADCSLREAMTAANTNPGADFIAFDITGAGAHLIQLTAALPELAHSVKLLNSSGEKITVRRNTGGDYRIFTVNPGQVVQISDLTITNGNDTSGFGGGGIYNQGTLTLNRVTVSDNTAALFGGGIYNFVNSTLNLNNSTISGNETANSGGGIFVAGTVNITNSTISGNNAITNGGISVFDSAVVVITSSTITNNAAQQATGGIAGNGSNTILRNTIVANNTAPTISPNMGGAFNSQGYNLLEDISGATITETQNAGTNIIGQDPNLGALQGNGGTTATHALQPNSPAIDTGNSFGLGVDQRGNSRPFDMLSVANLADGADIGAFELSLAPTNANVSVSGRILLSDGRGLRNARVVLTAPDGTSRTAVTSSFGYFSFADVAVGQTYIISVVSKRFQFVPQVIAVNEDVSDLNFTAEIE